jgi:hypothetical protein
MTRVLDGSMDSHQREEVGMKNVDAGQFWKSTKGFFLLGLLALFFCLEGTHPLPPCFSSNRLRVFPLREHSDLQAPSAVLVEKSDDTAFSEWNGLRGSSYTGLESYDPTTISEPEKFRLAKSFIVSFFISRSPPDSVL